MVQQFPQAYTYVKKEKTTQYCTQLVTFVMERLDEGATRISYSEPLGIVSLAGGEQGMERVISRNDEASQVGQELTTEIEDDKEEIESSQANDCVDLRDRTLLLKLV
jgi:hypothetical protein